MAMEDTDTLKPAVLEQIFHRQSKYTKLTAEEVKNKLNGDDWRQEWDHPQILHELLSEPIPPTTAEALPYEFDLAGTTTSNLL